MEKALILETSFVVDLERERRSQLQGRLVGKAEKKAPAHQFLSANASAFLHITTITAGELAVGVEADQRSRWEALTQPFTVLGVNAESSWQYGVAFRYLSSQGKLIGSNDLWIAAIAIAYNLPLVTHDREHFSRVPGLRIISY